MLRLGVELPVGQMESDLRLTAAEFRRAQGFAIADSLRALRTIARGEARKELDLRSRSVNRRVLSFPRRGRVWLGAGHEPLVTSFQSARLVPIRRARTVRGRRTRGRVDHTRRGVEFRGQRLEGVFVRTAGEYRNVPFRRVLGSLEAVRAPVNDEMRRAFTRVQKQAPEVIDRIFVQRAERIVQKR